MPAPIGNGLPAFAPLELPRIGETPSGLVRETMGGITGLNSGGSAPSTGPSFADHVKEAIQEVDARGKVSDQMENDYANGKQNDLHGTMIAMGEADVSLRLVAQVRNKCIEAYREVMRMGS